MVLFGLFASPPEMTIRLDGEYVVHKRVLAVGNAGGNRGEIQASELCPCVQDGDRISGRVIIRQRPGQTLEHAGIYIELIGAVERHSETAKKEDFSSVRVQLLATMADTALVKETIVLDFDFGHCRFPYQSYDGSGVSLRYYLRTVIGRKMSDLSKEATLWCPVVCSPEDAGDLGNLGSVELDVGLEEFLHIKLRLEKCRFTFGEEITGILRFLLVRVHVIDVEVSLVRKEMGPDDVLFDQLVITSKQILDGPAYKGDQVPIQLDLASVADRLSPTMEMVNKMFSVCYFLGVVLRDAEGRKYYKQVQIHLVNDHVGNVLPNYKLGLIADK